MQNREIIKLNWPVFFDGLSAAMEGKTVGIEIDSVALGAQPEMRRLSLNGLTYDARNDTLFVVTESLEHAIRAPQRIRIADGEASIQSMEILAADGSKHIVSFSEPVALPSSASA